MSAETTVTHDEKIIEEAVDDAIPSRERCHWCHEYSAVGFRVPNAVWALVVPRRYSEAIACVRCFARMADERLVAWDKTIKFFPVSLRTHHGRITPPAQGETTTEPCCCRSTDDCTHALGCVVDTPTSEPSPAAGASPTGVDLEAIGSPRTG